MISVLILNKHSVFTPNFAFFYLKRAPKIVLSFTPTDVRFNLPIGSWVCPFLPLHPNPGLTLFQTDREWPGQI